MIHVILGTKAQLIKMAPIMIELQEKQLEWRFIFTGQHQQTIDSLRSDFGLKNPDVTLHQHKDITGMFSMLLWMLKLISMGIFFKSWVWGKNTGPDDIVLVHGDTFSTLIGALIARLAGMKVAHVESGLRSFNLRNPFPEELTRLLVFRLSHIYFAPGDWAEKNLEKFSGQSVNTQQNTLLDSVKYSLSQPASDDLSIPNYKYALVSLHRFENIFDSERFIELIHWLEVAAKKIPLLFILHPPTVKQLEKFQLTERLGNNPNIELRPRYTHRDFLHLLTHAELLISDGGSNQEECSYLGKPCLLARNHTERQEGLTTNVRLCGNMQQLIRCIDNIEKLQSPDQFSQDSPSAYIVSWLARYVAAVDPESCQP
ncbi:UDP-N-acetyl glucosamine 2-epimerase [Pelagibaculum spongiae]|uniref:UDP-N-acetylglucosamine 2-epimerase domain-containing protein n=1 Tax=Pelagibaculum spongiae TaxID=2080658 RepID=A0A2V1H5Z7_9GAMM|nr:UDP-N-acetylglucosamine 2-epimerase [Pelagibaculum spongiae]PVZ71852.1 hypothetical protein DC094_02165 [Pelagibaculum spongiae]